MPRKPDIPLIPEKPTARTNPVKANAALRSPPLEQLDLWGAMADFGEFGEATEADAARLAKVSGVVHARPDANEGQTPSRYDEGAMAAPTPFSRSRMIGCELRNSG
jgi:hypothetical protein